MSNRFARILREGRVLKVLPVVLAGFLLMGCGEQPAPPPQGDVTPEAPADVDMDRPPERLVDEEMVGLPVYPGLALRSKSEGGDVLGDGTDALPAVVGHTGDSVDKVLAFYEERLADWHRRDYHGSQFFLPYEPQEDFNPLGPETLTRPYVSVMPPLREGGGVTVHYLYER